MTMMRGRVGKRFPAYFGTAMIVALAMTIGATAFGQVDAPTPPASNYIGDTACQGCHATHYAEYMDSGHPYKLNFVGGQEPDLVTWPWTPAPPLPAGKSWSDFSWVIGNFFWKARFVQHDGFIHTGTDAVPGVTDQAQWNLATQSWGTYHTGEDKGYDCGRCHTTGYDATIDPSWPIGITGTWQQPGVRCEACHGPGQDHWDSIIANQLDPLVAIVHPENGKDCDECHYRDAAFRMPWKGGFMRHHQQGEEFAHSGHSEHSWMTCNKCHDPHKSTVYGQGGVTRECNSCHRDSSGVKNAYIVAGMEDVACIDCHMADMGKSAVAENAHKGDVRGHLWRIMTKPIRAADNVTDLDGNGNLYWNLDEDGRASVTLDYACLGCHEDNGPALSIGAAAGFAKGIHDRTVSPFEAPGGIEGTAHDFDAYVADDEDGCIVCHDGPNWTHKISAQPALGYALTSSTIADVGQPGTVSQKCLDCHDGSVPVDAFGGSDGTAGTEITGVASLTTDLKTHHPVGYVYDTALSTAQPILFDPNAIEPYRYSVDPVTGEGTSAKALLLDDDNVVKCTTCHDQHTHFQANNPTNAEGRYSHVTSWGKFVKYDHLCFMCHMRYQPDVSPTNVRDIMPVTTQTQTNLEGVVTNGHHFPGRDDPYGIARGVDGGAPQKFACNMCHDIEANGPDTPGAPHNSPCVDCHTEYDPFGDVSPADSSEFSHHAVPGDDRGSDPLKICGPCHADEDPASATFGMLTGGDALGTQTTGCSDCHADIWSVAPAGAFAVEVADVAGAAGSMVTLAADLSRTPGFEADDTVTVMWIFNGETSSQLPVTSTFDGTAWVPALTTTHVVPQSGEVTGYVSVTDGEAAPISDAFAISIQGAAGGSGGSWAVTTLDATPEVTSQFDITFTPHDDSLVGVAEYTDGSGLDDQLSFGLELQPEGVIFWMDLWMNLDGTSSWGVGNMYFGNIARTAGEMDGVVFLEDGGMETFDGDEN